MNRSRYHDPVPGMSPIHSPSTPSTLLRTSHCTSSQICPKYCSVKKKRKGWSSKKNNRTNQREEEEVDKESESPSLPPPLTEFFKHFPPPSLVSNFFFSSLFASSSWREAPGARDRDRRDGFSRRFPEAFYLRRGFHEGIPWVRCMRMKAAVRVLFAVRLYFCFWTSSYLISSTEWAYPFGSGRVVFFYFFFSL